MSNRLATATSPYLLQHKENPVDWWEWGEDAFAEARRRDVPILLSVGYAACHWCHVMAHESFEDEVTAAYLNEHFVNVKVDREERPDVDAVYMNATTSMTGQGGWPMTVVLDHDGAPFFAGTYFPDQPRQGMPAFRQVLEALIEAWTERRADVRKAAGQVRDHLAITGNLPQSPITAEAIAEAVETLASEFDPMSGGFGGAPKFPPTMVLEFFRRVVAADVAADADSRVRHMLNRTVTAMARGGLYDQLGGGFARYSVDQGWVVPHFEKMLYDNAQLLGLYARIGHDLGTTIARETADFMIRELQTPDGGFASALDADTDGEEGTYYVWDQAELLEILGEEDAPWAAEVFQVTVRGTFEHGKSTLQLRHPPEDTERFVRVKAKLLAARAERTYPERDDKVVAAWNGLAISGLVDAGLLMGEPAYVDAAVRAGELLAEVHLVDGALRRVSKDGVVGSHAGVLEDYGCVASGFLALVQATGEVRWLTLATELLDHALDGFRAADGGFHDTHAEAEALIARPRDPGDNASPSGTSSMIHALVTAHALTGQGRYRDAAEQALATVGHLANRAPRFAGWSLAAAVTMLDGPLEIAVVGPAGADRDALAAKARQLPGAVVVVADDASDDIPLLAGRTAVDGQPAAYVCRGFVCERPVTDPADLSG